MLTFSRDGWTGPTSTSKINVPPKIRPIPQAQIGPNECVLGSFVTQTESPSSYILDSIGVWVVLVGHLGAFRLLFVPIYTKPG